MAEQQRVLPRYPVYIISKGRYENPITARCLKRDGVPFRIVVEPQEADHYGVAVGAEHVLTLPFANLGKGSIPARNWVWEHAVESGAERHWILDDNLYHFYRRYKARKVYCDAGPALRAAEDFTDRYENIAIAGLNYDFFAPDRSKMPPFYLNHHVYSCLLIRNDLPHRWRGRYNEDTDLCLQVLSAGWCTVLFNAFLVKKVATMRIKGGNADELYKGDGRLQMARALERQWPGVVTVKRRFKRPQHHIANTWKSFDTKLIRKPDAELPADTEYGMDLKAVKPVTSEDMKRIYQAHQQEKNPCDT